MRKYLDWIKGLARKFRKDESELSKSLTKILGFRPGEIQFYELALSHSSSAVLEANGTKHNNERLEFLGDSVLSTVVSDILYHKFENKREGFLSSLRSKIVRRDMLNHIAHEIGLSSLVKINLVNNTHHLNVYGNAFEALIGAIYLDKGYDYCYKFVNDRLFVKYMNVNKLAKTEVNFKSKVLEWCQKHKLDVNFDIVSEDYDDKKNIIFKTKVYINGVKAGDGNGYSKKESHQVAAKSAYNSIRKHPEIYLNPSNNKCTSIEHDDIVSYT